MRDIILQLVLGVVFTMGGAWGALAGGPAVAFGLNYFWLLAACGIVNILVALARYARR